MKQAISFAIILLVSIGHAGDERILSQLIDRSSHVVALTIVSAENGTSVSDMSTEFHISGIIVETFKGDLKSTSEIRIRLSNPLFYKDMNPVAVEDGAIYCAFLNPVSHVDLNRISHYRIQDPPFGMVPLTQTLKFEIERAINTKPNKAE